MSVSSFGVFLALGFLVGVFLIWRLARAWDLNEEKILDLTLLTFLGGLIGARLFFALGHMELFAENMLGIILINKLPGFSFWGGFLGGWLTLYFFTRKKGEDFWQISDIAAIGFLGGLVLTDVGCFLGGCSVGIQSNFFLASHMVGFLGRRFPTQILEAALLFLVMIRLWPIAVHFHPRGKILSLTLIYVGAVKFLMEPLRQRGDESLIFPVVLIFLGAVLFYKVTKRHIISDLKNLWFYAIKLITVSKVRRYALERVKKYWYNQTTSFSWNIRNLRKTLRRFNVRFPYKKTQ